MKKIGLIVFSFLLSFFVLEVLASLYNDDCNKQSSLDVVLGNENLCPYVYEPYQNIVYDFISKDISTSLVFKKNNQKYAELKSTDLRKEEGEEIVEEAAVKVKVEEKPKIVIVIDDMGISKKRSYDIMSLNAPLTLSFLTYSKNLDKYFEELEGSEFEVMAHIPMEAKTKFDEAPDTLYVSEKNEVIEKEFIKMLEKFDAIKFVNNHTGSLFTENKDKMNVVMKVLKEKKIGFLDSKTSAKSVAKSVAEKHKVEYFSRNVFLDNKNDFEYIMGQLKQTERIAKKNGYAIAIAHPKSQTYNALKSWLAELEGFEVVNLRDLSF